MASLIKFPKTNNNAVFVDEIHKQLKTAQSFTPHKQHLMWLLKEIVEDQNEQQEIRHRAAHLMYDFCDERRVTFNYVNDFRKEYDSCELLSKYIESARSCQSFWHETDCKTGS